MYPTRPNRGKHQILFLFFKRPQVRTLLERLWLQRTPAETTDTFCLHVASLKAITTQILSTFFGAYTWTPWQKYFWNPILLQCGTSEHAPERKPNGRSFEHLIKSRYVFTRTDPKSWIPLYKFSNQSKRDSFVHLLSFYHQIRLVKRAEFVVPFSSRSCSLTIKLLWKSHQMTPFLFKKRYWVKRSSFEWNKYSLK